MSITNVFNEQGGTVPSAGGGGASNIASWQNLTPSDIQTNAGGYTTFSAGASSESGFNLKVNIGCDLLVTTRQFPYTTAAVIFYDTGITKSDIGNGDNRIITVQTMIELFGTEQSGAIRSDTTHEHSLVPFVTTIGSFPFTTGASACMSTGVSFEQGRVSRFPPALLRTTNQVSVGGIILGAGATLLAFGNEVTLTMRDNPFSDEACYYRGESQAFWDNSGTDALAAGIIASLQDVNANAFATSTDTLKIGVAFHMNRTQDASVIKEWNINLKWRLMQG